MPKKKFEEKGGVSKKKVVKEFPNNFIEELQKLCNKYEITDASFAGSHEDKLIGAWDVDKSGSTINSVVLCSMNIARLYQAVREQVLRRLDKLSGFEY